MLTRVGNLVGFRVQNVSQSKTASAPTLHFEYGRSKREIARIINVSHSMVSDQVAHATMPGLTSPLPVDCDDAVLERRLFLPSQTLSVQRPSVHPNCVARV
ncbi:hypothetical protein CNX70_18675 [Janthinobacterium svalbardensis]|uniref:Uncharacterized protein n=1 Tax=Janthinobacterium svalbardensis TaxID=368607 RepID=A0A290WYF1_9BURK|nr:hypothetical protein CNX70_18675 [Janthinobacterium svalbardensis]